MTDKIIFVLAKPWGNFGYEGTSKCMRFKIT